MTLATFTYIVRTEYGELNSCWDRRVGATVPEDTDHEVGRWRSSDCCWRRVSYSVFVDSDGILCFQMGEVPMGRYYGYIEFTADR